MGFKINEYEMEQFITTLGKVGPIEFIGIATWFGINCFEGENKETPKDSTVIMAELLDAYSAAGWTKRKKALKLLKKSRVK